MVNFKFPVSIYLDVYMFQIYPTQSKPFEALRRNIRGSHQAFKAVAEDDSPRAIS